MSDALCAVNSAKGFSRVTGTLSAVTDVLKKNMLFKYKSERGKNKMKKSECYKKAQLAVLETNILTGTDKLCMLRVLMEAEDLELYREEKSAAESEVKDNGNS